MKAITHVLPALLCAGSVAAATAPGAQVGLWKKNLAESINMPEAGYQETVLIRRSDSILDFTWNGVAADGTKSTFSYTGKVDGKARELPGGMGIVGTMILTPEGVTRSLLKYPDGSLEDKMCVLVVRDKMICYATLTDASGKPSIFKEVFDRLPGPSHGR